MAEISAKKEKGDVDGLLVTKVSDERRSFLSTSFVSGFGKLDEALMKNIRELYHVPTESLHGFIQGS